jgi:IS30 family transposase
MTFLLCRTCDISTWLQHGCSRVETVFHKEYGQSNLTSLVERKSRYTTRANASVTERQKKSFPSTCNSYEVN